MREQLAGSINNSPGLRLKAYAITSSAEDLIAHAVDLILSKYDAGDLQMSAKLILKELTTNAVKANLKYWLVSNGRLAAPSGSADFAAEFRKVLTTHGAGAFLDDLAEANLPVMIDFSFSPAGLLLQVANGYPMSPEEAGQLQEKLAQAAGAGDLRQFHDRGKGAAEGAGLGFALVLNVLKSAGLDPGALTFAADPENRMAAKIFIPFPSAGKN
jgi:hypothetical protein